MRSDAPVRGAVTVVAIAVVVAAVAVDQEQGGCNGVVPIWSLAYGPPSVAMDESSVGSPLLVVEWNLRSVLFGAGCVHAFEVESQELGAGRRTWSQWSSLVSCAIVVNTGTDSDNEDDDYDTERAEEEVGATKFHCTKRLTDFDCAKRMRFRVLMYNVLDESVGAVSSNHEEVLIQCKDKFFFVRAPHKDRFQQLRVTTPEPKRVSTTTGASAARTTTTTRRPVSTTTKALHSTTTASPSTNSSNSAKNTSTPLPVAISSESPLASNKTENTTTKPSIQRAPGTAILVPGKYRNVHSEDVYEVRSNLKNFEVKNQTLGFVVRDLADECSQKKDVHRGLTVCLASTRRIAWSTSSTQRFKMLLHPECGGEMMATSYKENNDDCQQCQRNSHGTAAILIVV